MDTSSHDETIARKGRVVAMRERGIDPYPAKTKQTHSIADVQSSQDMLASAQTEICIAGRIRSVREHGKSTFLHIEDGTGAFQVFLKKDELHEAYDDAQSFIDVGDFIEVSGTVFTTKKGEHTVLAKSWTMLSKAREPLPEKWHGLQDIELRFRKRYLDLLSNKEVRSLFITRANIVRAIRSFLDSRAFIETETPILQPLAGGASARPFVTHHNALHMDLFLRIAPELYLKRLIVGGYDKVYEIARCFRNEGIDWSHNPEFTQVEFYQAYLDYEGLMEIAEDLILSIVDTVVGKRIVHYQEMEITFNKPFQRVSFRQALIDHASIDIEDYPDTKSLYKKAQELGLKDVSPKDGRGKLCDELYKELVRKHIVQPTFIIDHPIELSPLAKKKADDPRYVERFQLVLGQGIELCNAFTELNDPDDQRERFIAQAELKEAGDDEAQPLDEDYIEALMHGLPPTAGFGMGIDRLTGFLTDKRNIKEVILFPTLRPKNEQ